MRIEALVIGDELLDGRVTDTNSVRLGRALRALGLSLARRTTIIDDVDVIAAAAAEVAARGTTLCVVSGGLGPTVDDVTAMAFAQLAGVELRRDSEVVARLEAFFLSLGRSVTSNQLRQADRPTGAERLDNPLGTAPGFALEVDACRFVSVPGVPREFDGLVDSAVLEDLQSHRGGVARRLLRCFGLGEGRVDTMLSHLTAEYAGLRLGYRASFPVIDVSFFAPSGADDMLDRAVDDAREILGEQVFSEQPGPFASALVAGLRSAGETVAIAESCTGGAVSDLLTQIPGVSAVFAESVVTYSNRAKIERLGVPEGLIAAHGAVSEEVVSAMAVGVRSRARASWGLATSGIAGPSGGSEEKPVGLVWLAVAGPKGVNARCLQSHFERDRTKALAAHSALDFLRRERSRG